MFKNIKPYLINWLNIINKKGLLIFSKTLNPS